MRFTAASLLLLPLAALASPIAQPSLAPLEAPSGGDHIDDAYIVVFKKGVDVNQIALHIGEVQELHAASVSIAISSLAHLTGIIGRKHPSLQGSPSRAHPDGR